MLLVIGLSSAVGAESRSNDSTPITLDSGWQYRWGDSPVDSAGIPAWTYNDEQEWQDTASLFGIPNRNGQEYLWLRLKLPEIAIRYPSLFLPSVMSAFEAYLDSSRIHQFGDFVPTASHKYSTVSSYIFPLPVDFRGKTLFLRIYSSEADLIGIQDIFHDVLLGSKGGILKQMFLTHVDSFLIGVLFVFIGLFSLFVFARRLHQRDFFPVSFSFSAFATFMGLFYVTVYPVGHLFFGMDVVRYYVGNISYYLFPVGLYAFFENIVGNHRIVRTLWLLHLAIAVLVLILDLSNIVAMPVNQFYFNFFFIATILVSFAIGVKAAYRGNVEAKVFVAGFSILGLTGMYDLLVASQVLPFWHGLSHWGTFVFLLALGSILERRFTRAHIQLQAYSQELETKSQELKQYSETLEQRVAERTSDLRDKNKRLEVALSELKETQKQLIIQEKMASLGNLVAGIAHEVNNPIGAVASASDVSARCIEKIKSLLNGDDHEPLAENKQFLRSLQMLEDNSKVSKLASERIARIVKSLKTFARLDEAEFQEANLHEGLDSTLTLLHHETKNRIEIVKEYGSIPMVECYPNQLNQVFMNILINAIQAIEGKGTITVRTYVEDNEVKIQIADSGRGIPPDKLDKIFDPGYTSKSRGIGTGLGLSISYSIIEKHSGRIEVESEVGKGSTFTISLAVKGK